MLRSNLRARTFLPAAGVVFALIAIASFSGCFISFAGYELGDAAGTGGQSALAGHPGAGLSGAAGDDLGGASSGGDGELAGAVGHGGSAGKDGVAGAPNGGAGHSAGAAGANAGGSSNGGSAGTAGPGTAGAGTAGAGGGTLHCADPLAVQIPITGGSFFCIDRGEVKNAEYKAFMDGSPGTGGQQTACTWNVSYVPDTANGCDQYDPVGKKNQPVACVDWCDAAAYCKWVGKHLCGKIGGGTNPMASFVDASKSAWYRACSHAGDLAFPYGNSYDNQKCVDLEYDTIHPVAVPHTDCEGGYSGLYDMSGNVAEWEDSCAADSGATDQCLQRGGSYLDTNVWVGQAPSAACNSSGQKASKARSTRDKEIGFRCCSEPVATP